MLQLQNNVASAGMSQFQCTSYKTELFLKAHNFYLLHLASYSIIV
jgi:hypothetical protein